MNEGIATCRAMVNLLREFPDFRFIRGEAAIYAYIERHAPALFADIHELVEAGRWDIVGGNWIQPDTNLPSTEALVRQFVRGKRYFREKFGVEVTSAWSADSFGHAVGLPDIFAAVGLQNYAFTRPQKNILPLQSQAFWWRGRSGARILAYRPDDGWYASERAEIGKRLDDCLAHANTEDLDTVAMFYGLGDHGGGPSRVHLREICRWADQNPEVRVVHSGLHRFFAALREELAWRGEDAIPTRDGELNFCLRGCSASVARFKFAYRKAEARVLSSERTVTALSMLLADRKPSEMDKPSVGVPLQNAWDTLLFNAFHDILPGSSIERAFDDQLAQVGGVFADAQRAETAALTDLAAFIDTGKGAWPVPAQHPLPQAVLVWNSHPWKLRKQIEVEVSLDYRPLWTYQGRHLDAPVAVTDATGHRLPHQIIEEENDSMIELLWRRRVVVPVEVPPLGWTLLHMGLDPLGKLALASASTSVKTVQDANSTSIGNGLISLSAKLGTAMVTFTQNCHPWMPGGLQVRLYEDPWGAWGGMNEERASWTLAEERKRFTIEKIELLEKGPERASLWVRFSGEHSRVDVTFLLGRDSNYVELRVRAFLDDRGARLKLVLPAGGMAEYSVPGGTVRREPCGEVPGGRWVKAGKKINAVGFASDALYGFDTTDSEFRATIARTSRYASDVKRAPAERPWQPCSDLGEHRFRALLTPDFDLLPHLADELQEPPVTLTVPFHTAEHQASALPSCASIISIKKSGLSLLALTPIAHAGSQGVQVRLQNNTRAAIAKATIYVFGHPILLGKLKAGEIATWLLVLDNSKVFSARLGCLTSEWG
jgi:alpha-mannosidase